MRFGINTVFLEYNLDSYDNTSSVEEVLHILKSLYSVFHKHKNVKILCNSQEQKGSVKYEKIAIIKIFRIEFWLLFATALTCTNLPTGIHVHA